MAQINLFTKHIESEIQKTNLWLPVGKINREIGIDI